MRQPVHAPGSEAAGPRFLLFQSGRTMAPSLGGMPGSFRVFTKSEMDEPVDEIIASIGELGNGTNSCSSVSRSGRCLST